MRAHHIVRYTGYAANSFVLVLLIAAIVTGSLREKGIVGQRGKENPDAWPSSLYLRPVFFNIIFVNDSVLFFGS